MNPLHFQKTIWDFYEKNKRDFPWRETTNPYNILISEIMLQQTQTYRVVPKYEAWIKQFPDFPSLARSDLASVLRHWSGLGYKRSALYLHQIAKKVVNEHDGKLPLDPETLQTFPGIGKNTAGSIYVFSTNKPYVFIETNIRRVFIHHFFKDQIDIHDKDILTLVKKSIDLNRPQDWYYALMDYGVYLSKQTVNPNRKSKHYTKQSKFEGSLRQIRGAILKILLERKKINVKDLDNLFPKRKNDIEKALGQLEKEGFIKKKGYFISLVTL